MKKQNEGLDHIVIGRALKAIREESGQTQLNIASQLGYRNVNFIYLIEQGRSNIPVGKILDLVEAYKINKNFAMAIVKHLHPDIWDLFKAMVKQNYSEMKDFDSFEANIEGAFVKKAEEYGVRV